MEFPARLFFYGFLLTIVILSQTSYGLPINTEEREKLTDILTRLDRTLNDLNTWLATEKKKENVVETHQEKRYDDATLEDLLRYLLKIKSEGKNTQASKRDFDIPFPISS